MNIESYRGLDAPIPEIVGFLDALGLAPAQHDPRWGSVFSELPNEAFYVLVAREGGGSSRLAVMSFSRELSGLFFTLIHIWDTGAVPAPQTSGLRPFAD